MTISLLAALLIASPRERLLFDRDWHFALNAADRAKAYDPFPPGTTFGYFAKAGGGLGAAKADFDDSKWRRLDLPHDWAVELPFEYRDEPTPFGWPNTVSHFGILDLCGFPKDNFYYYRAWWKDGPSLHLFPQSLGLKDAVLRLRATPASRRPSLP